MGSSVTGCPSRTKGDRAESFKSENASAAVAGVRRGLKLKRLCARLAAGATATLLAAALVLAVSSAGSAQARPARKPGESRASRQASPTSHQTDPTSHQPSLASRQPGITSHLPQSLTPRSALDRPGVPTAAPTDRALAHTLRQTTGLSASEVNTRDVCPPVSVGRARCAARALVLRSDGDTRSPSRQGSGAARPGGPRVPPRHSRSRPAARLPLRPRRVPPLTWSRLTTSPICRRQAVKATRWRSSTHTMTLAHKRISTSIDRPTDCLPVPPRTAASRRSTRMAPARPSRLRTPAGKRRSRSTSTRSPRSARTATSCSSRPTLLALGPGSSDGDRRFGRRQPDIR